MSKHRIAILLFLQFSDKNNIMRVMQNLEFMQEFAVNVECLHNVSVFGTLVMSWFRALDKREYLMIIRDNFC